MSLEHITLKIVGVDPMLMHSSRLADPLDPVIRAIAAISGKNGKTEADYARIAEMEWHGGLWLHNGRPCIPAQCIKRQGRSQGLWRPRTKPRSDTINRRTIFGMSLAGSRALAAGLGGHRRTLRAQSFACRRPFEQPTHSSGDRKAVRPDRKRRARSLHLRANLHGPGGADPGNYMDVAMKMRTLGKNRASTGRCQRDDEA